MTRATKQSPAPAEPEDDTPAAAEPGRPTAAETALHLAQLTALGVARGTGSVARTGGATAAYLLGQGFSLARTALERRRTVPVATTVALVDEQVAASAPRSRRLRRFVVFGGITAVAVAGVAVWRLRRPQPAPVAERPPSVRDIEADRPADEQA